MIWTATLTGQPPSLNALYEIAFRTARNGRRYKGIVKNHDAARYHDDAVLQLRSAKNKSKPVFPAEGYLRVRFRLYLGHEIDSDNTLKVLSDSLQTALGINDKRFLHCIELMETGHKDPRVEVTVTDQWQCIPQESCLQHQDPSALHGPSRV